MEEIRRTLCFINKLLANTHSLYGSSPSIKCIVDKDGQFELTTNGFNFLKAVQNNHWVYDIIYEDCMCFVEKYGYGSSLFLIFINTWCTCYRNLLYLDIPVNIVSLLLLEILEHSSFAISEKYVVEFQKMDNTEIIFTKTNVDKQSKAKTVSDLCKDNSSSKLCYSTDNKSVNSSTNRDKRSAMTVLSKPSGTINFSRYSRHAMIDSKEADKRAQKENLYNSIRLFCNGLCECDMLEITDIITNLYLNECSYVQSKGSTIKAPSQLFISSDRIIVQSYVGSISNVSSSSQETSVFKGIPLECNDWFFFDILKQFHQKIVNVVLINTNVYGDNLPDHENLEVTEVVTGYRSHLKIDAKPNYIQMLKELDVSLVLYRGNLDDINLSEYAENDIAVVSVKDFALLYKLSLMLSCKIIYSLKNIRKKDISGVNLCLYMQPEHRQNEQIRVKYTERNCSVLYFILNSVDSNDNTNVEAFGKKKMYHSIILIERTKELGGIKVEKFWEAFNQVQVSLRDKLLIQTKWFAEKKLIESISESLKDEHLKSNYSAVQWMKYDYTLYLNVISKELISCLESLIKCYPTSDQKEGLKFESFNYRKDLWNASLQCVKKCTETRLFDMKF